MSRNEVTVASRPNFLRQRTSLDPQRPRRTWLPAPRRVRIPKNLLTPSSLESARRSHYQSLVSACPPNARSDPDRCRVRELRGYLSRLAASSHLQLLLRRELRVRLPPADAGVRRHASNARSV